MLCSGKSLIGYRVNARDGHAGSLYDIYFDDASWSARHMVVETGAFLWRHKTLVPPESVGKPDWVNQSIAADLTRDEIKMEPRSESDKPVFRQMRDQLTNFNEWATHWTPASGMPEPSLDLPPEGDQHLRSIRHLLDGRLETSDGAKGHMVDFIFDDTTWQLAILVIEIGGHAVAAPADAVTDIIWDDRLLKTRFDLQTLQQAPAFNAMDLSSQDYLSQVNDYYRHLAPSS